MFKFTIPGTFQFHSVSGPYGSECHSTANNVYQATTKAIIQVAFDLKLFGLLPEDKNHAVGSAELATKTGAEQTLLGKSKFKLRDE